MFTRPWHIRVLAPWDILAQGNQLSQFLYPKSKLQFYFLA